MRDSDRQRRAKGILFIIGGIEKEAKAGRLKRLHIDVERIRVFNDLKRARLACGQ
jgi:hypothetical protein